MRSDVVLPQPDGPTRTMNSPSWISRFRSLTATTSPYFFQTWSNVTVAMRASLLKLPTMASRTLASADREVRWTGPVRDTGSVHACYRLAAASATPPGCWPVASARRASGLTHGCERACALAGAHARCANSTRQARGRSPPVHGCTSRVSDGAPCTAGCAPDGRVRGISGDVGRSCTQAVHAERLAGSVARPGRYRPSSSARSSVVVTAIETLHEADSPGRQAQRPHERQAAALVGALEAVLRDGHGVDGRPPDVGSGRRGGCHRDADGVVAERDGRAHRRARPRCRSRRARSPRSYHADGLPPPPSIVERPAEGEARVDGGRTRVVRRGPRGRCRRPPIAVEPERLVDGQGRAAGLGRDAALAYQDDLLARHVTDHERSFHEVAQLARRGIRERLRRGVTVQDVDQARATLVVVVVEPRGQARLAHLDEVVDGGRRPRPTLGRLPTGRLERDELGVIRLGPPSQHGGEARVVRPGCPRSRCPRPRMA